MILIFFRYLVGHYRNHHGGLPPGMEDREQFICEQCSQVFLSENSLHNHISNKHIKGPQKMHCEECNQDFKGQLISKCIFGAIVSTKKTTIFLKNFCPSL